MMRFKVTAPKVLGGPVPTALVIAALRTHKGFSPELVWVLLSFDERAGLWRMSQEARHGEIAERGEVGGLPALIRSHAFDAETGLDVEAATGATTLDPLSIRQRAGRWGNGETLWVSVAFARQAADVLAAWRVANPPSAKCIHAPSWNALTAVRKLALAAGMPDPGGAS